MSIKALIETFKENLKKYPSILLLVFVYAFIIPRCLSYDQAWVQPEDFYYKLAVLKTGENVNLQDFKNGLNWKLFEEHFPRPTRPLSSYFEIIDTKFRVWLWHYMMPHPSLSLTWIFSFILAPLFLYRLLKNCCISPQVAMALVAFYLVTPGVLSYEAMLFRPAKPMANFTIIFILYLASRLKINFIDRQNPIPFREFLIFWIFTAVSFYWDETVLLIFPAIIFFFPQLLRRKLYLLLWLSLPFITYWGYFKIIPYLSSLAGYGFPHLTKFYLFESFSQAHKFGESFQSLSLNAQNLILESMGIVIPDLFRAPTFTAVCFYAALIAWGMLAYYVFKVKQKLDLRLLFLIGIVLFFNYIIFIHMLVWGPYYYGAFWSVFFVIYLACLIERAKIPGNILIICFFCILLNMSNAFLGTNQIVKKYHYYPYNPWMISSYFCHDRLRFDPANKPFFNGSQIKALIYEYWSAQKKGKAVSLVLPLELCWLPEELEPTKPNIFYQLLTPENKKYLKM